MDQVLPEGPLKVVTHIRPSYTLHSFLATFRREKVLFDSEEVLDNKLDHPLPFLLATNSSSEASGCSSLHLVVRGC